MGKLQSTAKEYLRSIIFGFEDSLVSTTGTVAGISFGVDNPKIVLFAGVVLVAVEAISMGAGQFLSEKSVHEAEAGHKDGLYTGAAIMLISYLVAGFIPLLPIAFLSFPNSVYTSVLLAFLSLFILGYVKGKLVNISPTRSGTEMLIVGGIATLVGVVVGILLKV